jgi:hypothetical protein
LLFCIQYFKESTYLSSYTLHPLRSFLSKVSCILHKESNICSYSVVAKDVARKNHKLNGRDLSVTIPDKNVPTAPGPVRICKPLSMNFYLQYQMATPVLLIVGLIVC